MNSPVSRLWSPVSCLDSVLRVLDMGSGVGWLSHQLARLGHRPCAIDLNLDPRDGLAAARYYPASWPLLQAEFDRLPLAGAQADVVVFNAALPYSGDYRVTLAGPTTLAAMLNSLQMGFRSLAISKQSTEVWRVLGAVKTEFGRFGEILAKTHERLEAVGKTLEEASRKSTTIARKLRSVEALPEAEADRLLTGSEPSVIDLDDDDEPSRGLPGA